MVKKLSYLVLYSFLCLLLLVGSCKVIFDTWYKAFYSSMVGNNWSVILTNCFVGTLALTLPVLVLVFFISSVNVVMNEGE